MKRLVSATLVALAVACSDGTATQYVGTVITEAAPETEGSLRLTFFARTDTSFAGVIELGAPARGTGSAYAWHEGPELQIVTVGAESGDTIHWISRLTDDGLGGRFEVTGGERTGQEGTWRANLVRGPPATPATLRSPQPLPLPPLTAIWPLLLLIATAIGLRRWILDAPRGTPATDSPWQPSGIGGWLALFFAGQVIGVLVWFARIRTAWDNYTGSLGIGAALIGMRPLVVLETAVSLLGLPLAVGGLILLARRSPYAPRYWFAYLVFTAVYLIGDLIAASIIHAQLARLLGAEVMAETASSDTRMQLLGQVPPTLIWSWYWVRSQRVRATFGAAALDRAVTAPRPASDVPSEVIADAPAVTQPERDSRRRRRLVLRSFVIVIVGFLVLLTYGLWLTRTSPYSVPEGADIRATVAGRWTWATDTTGCRGAHTIGFAEEGKLMTINRNDSSASDSATIYDVLSASQSTIRGAIRGETRMTDDGKPVVWDLVLTSPDEYRWKRADWSASPWSYTGKILRCPNASADTTGGR